MALSLLILGIFSLRLAAQAVTVTNVFQNHYDYGYPIGNLDCPTGYNIPAGQYSTTYHLERGHAIHHLDPNNPVNDYWVYWAHFDSSSYTAAEVAIFKSTSECGPYILQTGLYPAYNTDGAGYGFQPGGWQSRDDNIFRDGSTQTYNQDGSVANYASSYLVTATDTLNTVASSSGAKCGYANDSDAIFKMTPDYLGIDYTTNPSTNGANFVFVCDQREAPVMLKSGSNYFLVVSQAAGWYPSQGGYGVSSNPLTGWTPDPLALGNTSTFGGQTSDGFEIQGTQANTFVLSFDHLGGAATNDPANNEKYDTGGMLLPLILSGTTATLNWEPSWTVDNTTGVLTLPTMTNLALGKTASSTVLTAAISGTTTYVPSNALDGNYVTRWNGSLTGSSSFTAKAPVRDTNNGGSTTLCPITGATATTTCNPSLIEDLGSVQPVQEIDLSFYMVKGSEPYYTYKIAYSSDNVTWNTLDYTTNASASNAVLNNIGSVPFSTNNTFGFNYLPVNFSARYVALIETNVFQQNSGSPFYGPNTWEMAVIQSTAPSVPQTPTVTLTPSTTTPATDSSFSVGATVSGPVGQPVPTGYIQLSAPGFISETYSLVSGAANFTIPAGGTTGGAETLTVSYRADPTSVPIYGTVTTTGTVNVSVSSPDTPSGLTLTQSAPGVLSAAWTASTGASSYVLKRSSDGGNSYTQIATPTATSYVDSGLSNDSIDYCYTVSAVNNGGPSAPSAPVCSTATANFPVTNITVTQNGTTQLTVAYSAVTGAVSYIINRSVAGAAYTQLATPTATSYTDSSLTNGVNYCYTVAAVFTSGPGAASSPVCLTVSASIASLVVNGYSFESPSTTTYVYNPPVSGTAQPWTFIAMGTDTGPGGATNIGSGVATNNSGFTAGNSVAPAGTQIGFLQDKGSATQTLTGLTAGTTYKITVAASQRGNKSGGQLGDPFEIRIGGTTIATVTPTQGVLGYTDFSATFTATASSHILQLAGTNALATTAHPENAVFVDNIRLISYPPAASSSSTPNYLWLMNATGTLMRSDEQGSPQTSVTGTGSTPSSAGGIAIDATGGVWSVSAANNFLSYTTKSGGSPAQYTDPSLNAPAALAIDGAGTVWVANSGGTTVSSFTSAGVLIGTATDATVQAPAGIAIDLSGNVWVSNSTANTVTEILGAAAPVAPLSTAATNLTTGARP